MIFVDKIAKDNSLNFVDQGEKFNICMFSYARC